MGKKKKQVGIATPPPSYPLGRTTSKARRGRKEGGESGVGALREQEIRVAEGGRGVGGEKLDPGRGVDWKRDFPRCGSFSGGFVAEEGKRGGT